ncbi:SMI1/KNR4 family protein (plasmid) [Rhizobium sp. CB3060]|uniref:SMI1/KNR4 family protein n=1 Tax=Rhizobium sp. CB3060 TaxID=3138255 RepID=UPI0021A26113|nr:SMI1/KNR4 family protein [Rhizobium tropici]UWU24829.1 SMI1/KNR4 family protein [Rhizobium tropici]
MTAITDFENALAIVQANPSSSDFFGPAPDDNVEAAEQMLGIRMPPSYSRFLATLGVGSFDDAEFYGIVANKIPGSSVPSMIWRTLEDRKLAGYPKTHVTIMSSGYGPIFCLDGSVVNSEDEYPVVEWTPATGAANPGERLADSFGAFFLDEVSKRTSAQI